MSSDNEGHTWLAIGDTGPAVRAWQRIVGVHADGTFGPLTDAAVRAYQTAHGVEPDGAIGPLTRACVEPGGLIKAYEGLRLHAYDDFDGKPITLVGKDWRRPDGDLCRRFPTIGWGRRIWPGERIETCTREQADRWFMEHLEKDDMPAVRRYCSDRDAAFQAAAASLSYNAGPGVLASVAGHGFTRDAWMAIVHSNGVVDAGLVMRREEEYALAVPA